MEAWRLVEAGLASAADVDSAMSDGLGLRWSFMGPFETIDLNEPAAWPTTRNASAAVYQRIAASCTEHREWAR